MIIVTRSGERALQQLLSGRPMRLEDLLAAPAHDGEVTRRWVLRLRNHFGLRERPANGREPGDGQGS
jgi:hypothetical protein